VLDDQRHALKHIKLLQRIEAAYRKLFWYATEQRLLLDDRFYEEYMVDALTSKKMEQYITRIAVKILR
jgi:effector-binding domain-containing protein